jgi:hypothetical protein
VAADRPGCGTVAGVSERFGCHPVMLPKLRAGPLEALICCYGEFLVIQRGG